MSSTLDLGRRIELVSMDPYWIDRSEVTNRAFKVFVDARGYNGGEHWQVARSLPARPLHAVWRRVPWPPLELFSGPADVVHGEANGFKHSVWSLG